MVAKDNTRHRSETRQGSGKRPSPQDERTAWPFPKDPLNKPGLPKFNPNNFDEALF